MSVNFYKGACTVVMSDIVVFASHLAKYTGRNPFVGFDETVETFWGTNPRLAEECGVKLAPKSETHVESFVNTMTPSEREDLAEKIGASAPSREALVECVQKRFVQPSVSADTNTESKQTVNLLPSDCGIANAAEKDSRIQRGIARENVTLDKLAQEHGCTVKERNTVCYKATIGNHGSRRILLIGRIDGMKEDGSIVEVKYRRSRLFRRLVEYEKVQLHAYMHLCSNDCALLREQYDATSHEIIVRYDAAFWEECVNELGSFLDRVLSPPIMCFPSARRCAW